MSSKSADSPENDIADGLILNKYKTAGEIASEVLKKVVEACTPGRVVFELCAYGDSLIDDAVGKVYKKTTDKGVAFPTSISINACAQNYSPLPEDTTALHHGNVVKIELGVHIDGYVAMAGHTVVLNPDLSKPVTGRPADVVCAAYLAMESALRLLKPGARTVEITSIMSKMCTAYRCTLLDVALSTKLKRFELEGDKYIAAKLRPGQTVAPQPDSKEEDVLIEAGEVWCISACVSSGEGKLKDRGEAVKPSIFQRNLDKTYNLKLKASRNVFNEIARRFGPFPFTLSALEDKRGRLGILECVQHDLLYGYPVQFETAPTKSEVIAMFKCTVVITPNGNVSRITGGAPLSYVKSEYGVAGDKELGGVLEKAGVTAPKPIKIDAMDTS